ncbi:MAG TPA: type II toxin-antitoxin system RelE/ParE family toxin [Solirubrobacterales bacterium]
MDELSDADMAAVAAAMKEVEDRGLSAARHLQGKVYEVRTDGKVIYRILFAPQGKQSQILLSLVGFRKTTRKTPPQIIRLAQTRLRDWERRGSKASSYLL